MHFRPNAFVRTLLIGAVAVCGCAASAREGSEAQAERGSRPIVIDARSSGPRYDVVFQGNVSRLPALLEVSGSDELAQRLANKNHAQQLTAYLRAKYPIPDRFRIGNLFFGYSCAGLPFREMAVRDAQGRMQYQFDETIAMLDALVKAGVKPAIALSGVPRALVPPGEVPVTNPVYGCANAPALDLSKRTPRERAPDWWDLQDRFLTELHKHFGGQQLSTWEFATWTEPVSTNAAHNEHLVLPPALISSGKADEAVATIIAASIDVAMKAGVSIHIGNFAGPPEAYARILPLIRRFPDGERYLAYISGYAFSRYRHGPRQNLAKMVDHLFELGRRPEMPNKPIFLDEFGVLGDDSGAKPPPGAGGLEEAEFVGEVLARVFTAQNDTEREPRRVSFWNSAIGPRWKDAFDRPQDFVPSAATNLIQFFQRLNGASMIRSGDAGQRLIAGRHGRDLEFILLGPGPSRGMQISGLAPNRVYAMEISEIGAEDGNAISAFLAAPSYAAASNAIYVRDGKRWTFRNERAEKCFYDEISECAWREKGRRLASPKVTRPQVRSDGSGKLPMSLDVEDGGAVFVRVIDAY
jgi:hypothetical protein